MNKFEELNKRYGERDQLDFNDYLDYINELFDLYEEVGFVDGFTTSYDDYSKYSGEPFKVKRRVNNIDDDVDLDVLPQWWIEFNDGTVIQAFPEEICKAEIEGKGA